MTSILDRAALRLSAILTTPGPIGPHPPLLTPLPKLGVVQAPGKVGFTLNGIPVSTIDSTRFAGTPTLTVRPGPRERSTSTLACFEYAFCRSLSIVVKSTSVVVRMRAGRMFGNVGAPACAGMIPDTLG